MAVQNYVKLYVKNDGSLLYPDFDPIIGRSHLTTRQVLVTPWTLGNDEAIQVVYELISGAAGPRRTMNEMGTEEVLVNGTLETWNVYYYDITSAELNEVTSENTQTIKVQFRHIQTLGDSTPIHYSLIFDLRVENSISPEESPIEVDDYDALSVAIGNVDGSKLAKAFELFDDIGFITGSEQIALRIGNDNYKTTIADFRDYINAYIIDVENDVNTLLAKFTTAIINNGQVSFDQNLKTTDSVSFAQVTANGKVLNATTIGVLEDKYTVQETDDLLDAKSDVGHTHSISQLTDLNKGLPNGVASLDGTGRLPASQLPIETVVFKGTFGSVGSTTGGDLPTSGLTIGDFYICDADGFASTVAGVTFDNGDKAVYTGTGWSKIDNTETVTGIKGDEEVDYRVGNVSIGFADVGAAAEVHTHLEADITDLDKFTQQEVNDALALKSDVGHTHLEADITDLDKYTQADVDTKLLAKANVSHTHVEADITDLDKYTTTEVDGFLAGKSDVGHTHLEADITDLDKYTQQEVDDALALKLDATLKGAANGLAELGSDGKVPSGQLPSYVDDVLEFADLASFPATGESGKIYVALDTLKTYRWSGSAYVEIAANEVNSVNGYTGNVTLTDSDIAVDASGFSKILTTDDVDVELALSTLDQHTHLEADITNLDKYTQAQVDAFLAEKADVASLSASITLYPTTSASDVNGYFTMVTDITDGRYNTTAFDVATGPITTANQLVASLATDTNIFVGNPGVINVNTIGNIRKTAGSSNAYADFYFEIYKRDSAGTETLLGTSDTTAVVNPEDLNIYQEFSASALLNNGSFLATDRLVIKYYANAIDGTTAEYDFQFGGTNPVRTFLPVPVRVLQSADKIIYDNSTSTLLATNLQTAVDELDTLIAQNTSVIKIQRFVIVNADIGDGTFSYDWNGNTRIGNLVTGQYQFGLEDSVVYILGQNRLEIKVNNNNSFYSPDTEIEEIDEATVGLTFALSNGDEIFIKVYQGLDSVSLDVADGSVTNAKLSTALQQELDGYEQHVASTNNPHQVTKEQLTLGNVTNDAQVKKATSSTDGYVPVWDGVTGDAIVDGYGVQTTLSSNTTDLVRADAIATAVNAKQDTLVSGVNIKTLNGSTILGSGDYVIDIPSVDISSTAPTNPNIGDLWWNDSNGTLYIYYDDGTSQQWVSVSYADVQDVIDQLTAGAPEALDTLNELAAALGDDPNFATTVSTALADRLSKANGGTVTGDVNFTGALTKGGDEVATFPEIDSTNITADYTLVAADRNTVKVCTNSTAITITVQTYSTIPFPIGSTIAILANGTGTVSFAGASGVTINSVDGSLTMSGQYASAALLKTDTDVWQLVGSLA